MAGKENDIFSQPLQLKTESGKVLSLTLAIPDRPVAAVILLEEIPETIAQSDNTGENTKNRPKGFLARNASALAKEGFIIAIPGTSYDGSQSSGEETIETVIGHIRTISDVPIWLTGFGTGCLTAAGCASSLKGSVDGLVLLSPSIRSRKKAAHLPFGRRDKGISSTLNKITAPTLLVAHIKDSCYETPPSGAIMIRNKLTRASTVKIAYLRGGAQEGNDACGPLSWHCFNGLDENTVSIIACFIRSNIND